ncbi:HesB/YadR/YfhF family protein [Salirhabdus sp. Marseille-P4669]|uniref:HesB/YadR/YfhF family protein n=1 Tax=Salirhabdus sp. Marseille-P4669 TaxID=2042310 RepID=UPI000C79BB25|nr:hypothetical protein [Salirhabdus sp. Marseille-P4669]
MKFNVSNDAAKWFIEEFDLEKGDYVQISAKLYGGIPTVFPSYFLGITVGNEGDIAYQDEKEGITFYINNTNAWLLENHRIEVELDGEDVDFKFIED